MPDTFFENTSWVTRKQTPIKATLLPCMTILKLKRDENGRPARFKAGIVASENLQEDIGQLMELYDPVICMNLVQALLSLAQIKGWGIWQMDFMGAFLAHIAIQEKIFGLRYQKYPERNLLYSFLSWTIHYTAFDRHLNYGMSTIILGFEYWNLCDIQQVILCF